MSLLDDIRRDMAQGTPGPWNAARWQGDEWPENRWSVGSFQGAVAISPRHVDHDDLTDARRCARVPDMEKALLAAEELANTLDADMGTLAFSPATINALAAFRKATE